MDDEQLRKQQFDGAEAGLLEAANRLADNGIPPLVIGLEALKLAVDTLCATLGRDNGRAFLLEKLPEALADFDKPTSETHAEDDNPTSH